MRWHCIKAILVQQLYITRRHSEVWFDLFFFSAINIVLFGLIASYLNNTADSLAASYLTLGVLLWEVVRIAQYCITVNSLWSLWSHNLTNIFVSPITAPEYVISYALSSLIITGGVFSALSVVARLAFDFNIFEIGVLLLIVGFLELSLFAWTTGLVLLGLIFRFGTTIQALSWGAIYLLQPLSATYFPLDVLPRPLQLFAQGLPTTYVFEEGRRALGSGDVRWGNIAIATILNCFYLGLGCFMFSRLYRSARITGQFARNDA